MAIAKFSFTIPLLFIASFFLKMAHTTWNSPFAYGLGVCFFFLGSIETLNVLSIYFPKCIAVPIHWIRAMCWEFLAIWRVFLVRISCLSPRKWVGDPKGRPVLLVAGYMNDRSAWNYQRKRLKILGPIYTIDLGHPFRSICHYAEMIQAKAEQIARETGRKDLVLVGHSMGGLVSCWYATHFAPPGTITDLITIASPLSGTKMAYIAFGLNGREMEPDSDFILKLKEKIAADRETRFYHLATKTDQLIIPGSSALVEGKDHYVFEDIGHASMLYSPRVNQKIRDRLTEIAQGDSSSS